jgi:hypothetical protein
MDRSRPLLIPSTLLLLILTGCGGVPYQEIGDSGGHSTVPIGGDKFEIKYVSNTAGEQASTRMRELTLLRAAEVALEYGYTHFVVETETEDAQTKWTMRPTSTRIGGMGTSTGGISIGSPGSGIGIGGSSSGIGIGSSGIGGAYPSRTGTITSSAPVPVLIPELSIRIHCHRGVPTTAYQGVLYDAARVRDILAVQYNIDISKDDRRKKAPPPEIQVIE